MRGLRSQRALIRTRHKLEPPGPRISVHSAQILARSAGWLISAIVITPFFQVIDNSLACLSLNRIAYFESHLTFIVVPTLQSNLRLWNAPKTFADSAEVSEDRL